MLGRTSRRALFGSALATATSGCFGQYTASTETDSSSGIASTSTSISTSTSASTTSSAASTTNNSSSSSSTSSDTESPACEQIDILIITDVSVSMAPYAEGVLDAVFALGPGFEQILSVAGNYHFGITFNSPPLVNNDAYQLPPDRVTDNCTELGALVRGQSDCVEEFEGRPYLTADDELGSGLLCLSGQLPSGALLFAHEDQLTLDTLVATLESDDDPALSVCNEGFHQPGDPLIVVLIVDDVDLSETIVASAVARAIASQGGGSLENVGIILIGADAAQCDGETGTTTGGTASSSSSSTGSADPICEAVPSCRVHDFLGSAFPGQLFEDNIRHTNICNAVNPDTEGVVDGVEQHLTELVATLCG